MHSICVWRFFIGEKIMDEQKRKKKLRIPGEIAYFAAIILLAFAVAMLTSANFGISMIVAPAYLLSLKTGFLSFGQAEYVIQAGVFIVLCIVLRKFKLVYLSSFATCLIYGAVLDLWRLLPCFDHAVTQPGSMDLWIRIVMFVAGVLLTAFSVALFFKTYLYPQVYDFFSKAVSSKYGIKISVFKTAFDLTCLTASVIMTYCFFGKLVGVNWGTLVMAIINGTLIGFFSSVLDKTCDFTPIFRKFAALFELDKKEVPAEQKREQTTDEQLKESQAEEKEEGVSRN